MSEVNLTETSFRGKLAFLRGHSGFHHAPFASLVRLAIWRLRCWLGAGATVELGLAGAKLYLPPRWHGASKLIFAFREYFEPELRFVASQLPSGGVFVDVGANIGVYTAVAGRVVGDRGRVLAFEPGAESSEILARNVALNKLSNIQVCRCALADRAATGRLYRYLDPSRFSLGRPDEQADYEEVQLEPLDAILDGEEISRLDCIKMDVEGAEELVLKGARSTLERWRPMVIFEVNPKATSWLGLGPGGAWNFLAALGYEFHCVSAEGTLSPLKCLPLGGENVIAIHSGNSKP